MINCKQIEVGCLNYIATRDVPIGYRLNHEDFSFRPAIPADELSALPASLNPTGRYLRRGYKKGEVIEMTGVSRIPVFKLNDPGSVKYFFPLSNQMYLRDLLNVESRVDVCGATCLMENVRIASMVCTEAPDAKCFAVLELSKDQVDKMKGATNAEYRLFLHTDLGGSVR
jgi:hypothetical protein